MVRRAVLAFLALADLSGDGARQLVYGAYDGSVRVADSATGRPVWEAALDGVPFAFDAGGRPLWRFRTPFPVYNVAAAADLNGDKTPERIFGDTYFNKQAVLVAGASGEPLWISPPRPKSMSHWRAVASRDRWYEFYGTAWIAPAEAAADSPGLERQGLARRVGENLARLREQAIAARPASGRSESRHAIPMLGSPSSEEAAKRVAREIQWFRQRFPYPHLQPVAGRKAIEPAPPPGPGGKPWNPVRWQTDSLNGAQTVEQIVESARRVERCRIPTLFHTGHSCMPFVALETAEKILEAAPTATEGFLTAEDENSVEFPRFARHYLAPLASLAVARGGKKVMTKNKGLWWFTMPAEPSVASDLFAGARRTVFVSTTEDSNSRTPEINLMARVGLRQAGLVPRMRASIHQDLFSFNRFHQWEYPRSGSPYLRLLVAHAVLGAADFEFRISDRLAGGGDTEFTLLGRESTEIFLHLLGKNLVLTPRPDQLASLNPAGIAVHSASGKFKADAHNGHAPQNRQPHPELENAVLPFNGCLWGLTETAPHAITRLLFRKRRQFGYFVPPTPYGAVAMAPATADLANVEGVKEWWHTDGVSVWRGKGKKLTGAAAAGPLRASFENGARGLPFRAAGDDVFFQAVRPGGGTFRLYAIDPGWLDPRDRRIRIESESSFTLRDLLTGETLPLRNRAAELIVPAGALRILEAVR